ncbi:MAG TPA: NAD-dependent epimerase/dehydratase family protein [Polyangiaceae bacterium]|nr:NAD-dependent epimerase/dehydratase family protein [Polyangiaceae bacterium]
MAERTILLTGVAGFIGSHAASALLRRGERVVGLDNFDAYYDPARKRENLREVAAEAPGRTLELVEGDVRDRDLLRRLFEQHRFDVVIHLAAMAGVRASVERPWLYYDVNLTGTLNLLELTREFPSPSFVFASTSSAYGNSAEMPFVETAAADRPLAPYPASKRAAELLGHTYHHLNGLCFTALRFFTVYGPRGRPDMMAHKIMNSLRSGEQIPLYEGGRLERDWTYVTDIVEGVVAASERSSGYEIINLGRGEPVRVSDFLAELEACAGKKANTVVMPMPKADVEGTFADIGKARRLLGYAPRVSVSEGARLTWEWFEKTRV